MSGNKNDLLREELNPKVVADAIRAGRPIIPKILESLSEEAPNDQEKARLRKFRDDALFAEFESTEIFESFTLADVTISMLHRNTALIENGVAVPAGYVMRIKFRGSALPNSILDPAWVADAIEKSEPVMRRALKEYPAMAKVLSDQIGKIDPKALAAYDADVQRSNYGALPGGAGGPKKPPL